MRSLVGLMATKRPYLLPVISMAFTPLREHPQLVVFPVVRCAVETIHVLPQSHLHSQNLRPPLLSEYLITVRRPKRRLVKSFISSTYPLRCCILRFWSLPPVHPSYMRSLLACLPGGKDQGFPKLPYNSVAFRLLHRVRTFNFPSLSK